MPISIFQHNRVLMIRWTEHSSPEDVDKIVASLAELRETYEHPIFVTIIPTYSKPPEPVVRRKLAAASSEYRNSCSTFAVIIEGDSVIQAMKRTIVAGMFFMSRLSHPVEIASSLEDLLEKIQDAKDRRLLYETMIRARGEDFFDNSDFQMNKVA